MNGDVIPWLIKIRGSEVFVAGGVGAIQHLVVKMQGEKGGGVCKRDLLSQRKLGFRETLFVLGLSNAVAFLHVLLVDLRT